MPCTLLLASDPLPGGGMKAILHPLERGSRDSLTPAESAASTAAGGSGGDGGGGGGGSGDPASPAAAATAAGAAAAAVEEEVGEDTGPLVGLSVVLDCRVACTVELLWDVDLTLLGKEMGLHPKL